MSTTRLAEVLNNPVSLCSSVRSAPSMSARSNKRLRKESSSEISIEELFADDLGYDADVETLQPDAYEEPLSDTDTPVTPKRKLLSVDEDLAARMKHLGSDRSGTNSPTIDVTQRGRKRRNWHDESASAKERCTHDFEITELPHHPNTSPPRKRRKRSWLDSPGPRNGLGSPQQRPSNLNSVNAQKQVGFSDGDVMDMT